MSDYDEDLLHYFSDEAKAERKQVLAEYDRAHPAADKLPCVKFYAAAADPPRSDLPFFLRGNTLYVKGSDGWYWCAMGDILVQL